MGKREELVDKIDQTKHELKSIHGRCKAVQARADREHRDLTDADADTIARFMSAFESAEDDLKDFERQPNNLDDAAGAVSQGRVVPPQPINGGRQVSPTSIAPAVGGLFNAMFPQAGANRGPFANLGEFAKAVYERDPGLFSNSSGMSRGTGEGGGFYIPPGFLGGVDRRVIAI